DLQISSSFESEYNSNNCLNDCVSMDNLDDNDIFEDGLENEDSYELENGLENEHQLIFAQFGCDLTIDQIEYYLEFQEYPKTSLTGVASIYNVSGWESDDATKAFRISNIQYAYSDPGNIRSIQKYLFLGVFVQKTYRSYLSIKVYEFSSTTLDIEHMSVDFEDQLYKKIFDVNEFLVDTFTLNIYGQAYNMPCSYIDPITNICCDSNPIHREYKQDSKAQPINECFTIFPNSSTRIYC
ncbi:36306_t:CDS:2, partial [Racocetra persica]